MFNSIPKSVSANLVYNAQLLLNSLSNEIWTHYYSQLKAVRYNWNLQEQPVSVLTENGKMALVSFYLWNHKNVNTLLNIKWRQIHIIFIINLRYVQFKIYKHFLK